MSRIKRILQGLGAVVALLIIGGGLFAYAKVSAFDASMEHVYDIPLPTLTRSTDAAAIARGKHLAESVAPCANSGCHGTDLAGGTPTDMGPLGTFAAPNITDAGLGAAYTDGELARLLRHGIKKDGRSVRMMPSRDINWLSDADIVAILSYVRSMPPVERANEAMRVRVLGKILDRMDKIPFDVARRIDHDHLELGPPPAPTAAFGRFLARACDGCHGKTLAGGPIPGAPASMPVPLNLTPHETGLMGWSYEDFDRAITKGVRKNGKKLDPFMPTESFGKLDDVEKRALFAYLQTVPKVPFGAR